MALIPAWLARGYALTVAIVGAVLLALFLDSSLMAGTEHPESINSESTGGLEGRIIRVTSVADSGPGSLREALEEKGARLIVFEVAGRIALRSDLRIRYPFATIAGQTAPSPGITLSGGSLAIKTHDIVVSHLRVRVGDEEGPPRHDRDGIKIYGRRNGSRPVYNVIIDHCSVSWAIDEGISLYFPGVQKVTIRNSIIAESLSRAGHPKGPHSMALLVGAGVKEVSIVGNLLAHNMFRNPVISPGASVAVVNNLIYDFGNQAIHFYDGREGNISQASIVGNVVIAGPSSNSKRSLVTLDRINPNSIVFLLDNLFWPRDSSAPKVFEGDKSVAPVLSDRPPFWPSGLDAHPADEVIDSVLGNVGARPWDRDAVDQRTINEVMDRSGRIIDSQEEVGGWPVSREIHRSLTVPANLVEGQLDELVMLRKRWLRGFENGSFKPHE